MRYVLGSRSPRRRELLSLIVPPDRIEARPPLNSEELGFDGLSTQDAILDRLVEIARTKRDQVAPLCPASASDPAILICADTTIIGFDDAGVATSLGNPPDDAWADVVRAWFQRYLAGRWHLAATALIVERLDDGRRVESIATTRVRFRSDCEQRLEWYLAKGESRGKAGGYALQAIGSIFVEEVIGSLTNVVGLPLENLLSSLDQLR